MPLRVFWVLVPDGCSLQTLQHCSLLCRDVQVVMYSYCVDIILSPRLRRLQLAGQSETHPTADNHVSMSRTVQTAVSPAEQIPDLQTQSWSITFIKCFMSE